VIARFFDKSASQLCARRQGNDRWLG